MHSIVDIGLCGYSQAPYVRSVRAFARAAPASSAAEARAYWLAWLATITFFAGFYALLVPLPRYLAAVGLPDWQIGLVLGAFGVASLIGRPIAGVASDRLGPRQVMLAGAALLTLGALGVPTTTHPAALFALRVLQAGGYVAFTTAGTALVVSLTQPEERGQRLAVFGAAANVAIALVPAGIAALLEVAPVTVGLIASATCALLAGTLALALPARTVPHTRQRVASAWTIPRRLWLPMLIVGLLGAAFAAFFQFAPILAERRDASAGWLYTTYGAAIITTRVLGGQVLDRIPTSRIVVAAAVVMVFGEATLAFSSTVVLLAVGAALIAAGGGLFHPALLAHHAALLPSAPGRASAAFYVAFDLGIGLGSWLFGWALQLAGLSALYWSAAILAGGALLLAPRLTARPEEPARA